MTAKRLYYRPGKTSPELGGQRVISVQRSRFNPLRGFDPSKLVSAIEQFDAGYLGPLSRIIDALEQRDDTWKTAARKTKASVSRCQHQVLIVEGHEGEPAAEAHKETLEKFWSSIRVTDAFCQNRSGGRSLLVKQMMDAVGSVYACHEIVWKPTGSSLSAEFIRVPLWMFENTTGRLRYLPSEGAVYGVDMPDAEWLVTVGDGIGIACAVATMSKRLAFEDWLLYSERCGQPGLHAATTAKYGSEDWRSLVSAVRNYGREWNLVTNTDVKLNPVQMSTSGTLPYPELIARMDKAIAALWRGADLSTLSGASGGDNAGASLQGDESDLLEQDACEMISETLQAQVERHVIRYVHGDVEPLAYIQIMPEARPNLTQEMAIDNHLVSKGVKLSRNEALRRYQRTEVDASDPEDDALQAAASPAPAAPPALPGLSLANEALAGNLPAASAALASKKDKALAESSRAAVLKALDADLKPMRERIAKALQAPDDRLESELKSVLDEMPALFAKVSASGQLDKALEESITSALFNGFAAQALKRKGANRA